MTSADPISVPLTYPGEPPTAAASLVLADTLAELVPSSATPGEWVSAGGGDRPLTLNAMLTRAGVPPMGTRAPVLAIGSNASPAQLRRKFSRAGAPVAIPITAVTAHGIAVGVSAHVSAPGYVPATPVPDLGAVSKLFVTWLDADGLAVMDATEPNYDRTWVDVGCEVELSPGRTIGPCLIYVSKHGYLTNRGGTARSLTDQVALITGLLADVPGLAAVAGTTPQEWLARVKDERVRERIRVLFRETGFACQPAPVARR